MRTLRTFTAASDHQKKFQFGGKLNFYDGTFAKKLE
jgi:hypothetical protein